MEDAAFAAAFKQFMVAAKGGRVIKPIPRLRKQEEFPAWKIELIRVLKREDLDKYIFNDVAEPEDAIAKKQWRADRSDIEDFIKSMVPELNVWTVIGGFGWDPTAMNPKDTFEKLCQYCEKGATDSSVKILQEFATIRAAKFDKMSSFQVRINYLRQQIDTTVFKMCDDAYLWLAIKGIQFEYPDLYNRSVTTITNKTLTWASVMAELQQLAVSQNSQPAMSSITKIDKPFPKSVTWSDNVDKLTNQGGSRWPRRSDGNTTPRSDNEDKATCGICNKILWQGSKHCKVCGSHHKGDTCWWCQPELAPDYWPKKNEAMLKKTTSTTGPLHQQTGNSHPTVPARHPRSIIKENTKPANLFFQTNYDSDDEDDHSGYKAAMSSIPIRQPDFRQGPQRW